MTEPNRDARRRRIVERVKTGETRKEIMQNENISRVTLWSDLKALDSLFLTENSTEVKELKRRVGHALLESADSVLSGELAPDMANAWRAIMSDFSELFGLNSPKTAVVGHVSSANQVTDRDLWLREACSGLDDDELQQVLRFAKGIPRDLRSPEAKRIFNELTGGTNGSTRISNPTPTTKLLDGNVER
jgi:hypothetical protein